MAGKMKNFKDKQFLIAAIGDEVLQLILLLILLLQLLLLLLFNC